MKPKSSYLLGFLLGLLLALLPAVASPPPVPSAATGAPAANLQLTIAVPEKIDPGRLELRPYPSAREAALYFLRGEEQKPLETLEITGKERQVSLAVPFGFWQLTYRDSRWRRLDAPLAPLTTARDLGELTDAAGRWELQVLGSQGKAVAGAWVALRPQGLQASPWQPAFRRLQTDAQGRVVLPRPNPRGELWVLAPGYAPLLASYLREELPARVELETRASQVLELVGARREPLAEALVSTVRGLPLGISDAAGRLEGAFADGDLVLVEDPQGHRWRERVRHRQDGRLWLQVGRVSRLSGEVVEGQDNGGKRAGEAIGGALVWLRERPETWRRSDRDGQFELFDIAIERAERIYLEAVAPGHSRRSLPLAGGTRILELYPASRVLVGSLTGAAGEKLAGAQVAVSSRSGEASWRALSDAAGRYRITALPAEPLWVEVTHPAYLPARQPLPRSLGEVTLDFALERGSKIRGQVTSPRGKKLEAVAVLAEAASASEAAKPLGTSDREGRFEVGPLAAGDHRLLLVAGGFARKELSFTLAPGQEDLDLEEIELAEETSFRGRVVDERGAPLAGAAIFVWRGEDRRQFLLEWPTWRPADTSSDPAGRFALAGLASGETFGIEIRVSGRPPTFRPGIVVAGGSEEGEEEFVVPLGASLEVTVFDSRLEPLPAAAVTLVRERVDRYENWRVTDVDGKALYEDLAAGELELHVEAENYGIYRRQLELEKGESLRVQVVLGDEGATLDGRVLLPDGAPASGFQVFVDTGEKVLPPPVHTRVDEEGFYHLEGLPDGNFSIEISGRGIYRPIYRQKLAITLPQNQLDLTLPANSVRELEVRVLDEAGQPLAGVTVAIYHKEPGGGISSLSKKTAGDGIALFATLPRATYEIMAWAPDPSFKSGNARVGLDTSRQEVEIVLEKQPQ